MCCFVEKEEIKSYEEHVKKLLELTSPMDKAEQILGQGKNWVRMLALAYLLLIIVLETLSTASAGMSRNQ